VPEVILVRHAMPAIEPDVPPERWRLGEEGRAAARALADRVPRMTHVVTSDEPKAYETAEALRGWILTIDRRVAEASRPPVADGYRDLARLYVAGHEHEGWEPHERVVARFRVAIRLALGYLEPLVVVDHGLALTLWLRSIGAIADPAEFWSALAFPDAWAIEVRQEGNVLVAAGPLRRLEAPA
jgi:broad specificity phosphatase PhoE